MSLTIEGMRYVVHTPEMVDRLAEIMRARVAQCGALSVDIKAWVPLKTRRQRDYLHALIRECATAIGADERELKEDLKAQLGIVRVAPSLVTGDRTARIVPTELYSREETTAFLYAITAWAASRGIPTTPPDDHETADALRRHTSTRAVHESAISEG